MSDLKYDNRYGFLIANVIPFNILGFILSPLFFVTKNETALKRINYFLTIFSYLPIGLIATSIFLAANIILIPFAYIIGVAKKIQLINFKTSLGDLFIFIFFGLFIMALSAFLDTWMFFCHLFSHKTETMNQPFLGEQFTLDEFRIMHHLLVRLEKEHRKTSDSKVVSVKGMLLKIRKVLKVEKAISTMLFDPNKNGCTLSLIKTYNKIKKIILNCADAEKQVNLYILNGLLKEIRLNVQIAQADVGSEHLKRTLAKKREGNRTSIAIEDVEEEKRKISTKDLKIEAHFMKELNLLHIDRIVRSLKL